MGDYERFRELVERIEERLERPVTVHLSNGLVGFRCYLKNDPLNVEVLLSFEDNRTFDELVGALLRCVVKLEDGAAEYREPSSEPVDTELAGRAVTLQKKMYHAR